MKYLILAAAMALAPAAALAADISGVWTVDGEFTAMGIKFTSTCTLKQDASGALAGPCTGADNEPVTASGAVRTGAGGKPEVDFGYDTNYEGTPVRLEYVGAPQADGSLSGTVSARGAQGTFTATRK